MLKFLNTQDIVLEEGPIKVVMNPVTTSAQAKLMELSLTGTVSEAVERTQYALKNIITKIEIEGKDYPPEALANTIDLGDRDSRDAFIKIGGMVVNAAFMGEAEEKKSEQPPKQGPSGGSA